MTSTEATRETSRGGAGGSPADVMGILLCVGIGLVVLVFEGQVAWVPGPLLAIAAGILLGRAFPPRLMIGAGLAATYLLRAGIVLLGLRLSIRQLGSVGAEALLVIVPCITAGLLVALLFARVARLGGRLSLLLAVGTAICGNSAIAVVAPSINASDDEVTAAITAVTAYGTVALFVFPLIGASLDLSARELGTWIGTAVNDTSQVVGAAFSVSDRTGEFATIVKLARNLFLIPAGIGAAWLGSRDAGSVFRLRSGMPWFVIAFVAAAAVASLISLPEAWIDVVSQVSRGLILAALAGIGMRSASLEANPRFFMPVAVGGAAGLVLAIVSFGLVQVIV